MLVTIPFDHAVACPTLREFVFADHTLRPARLFRQQS
jgi:hypothetical protein